MPVQCTHVIINNIIHFVRRYPRTMSRSSKTIIFCWNVPFQYRSTPGCKSFFFLNFLYFVRSDVLRLGYAKNQKKKIDVFLAYDTCSRTYFHGGLYTIATIGSTFLKIKTVFRKKGGGETRKIGSFGIFSSFFSTRPLIRDQYMFYRITQGDHNYTLRGTYLLLPMFRIGRPRPQAVKLFVLSSSDSESHCS